MKVYRSISLTAWSEHPEMNEGFCHLYSEDGTLDVSIPVSYKTAYILMRELERQLGRKPTMINNDYEPRISYKELHGWTEMGQ